MEKLKVIKVNSEYIEFENEIKLYSEHISDCCENHYLLLDDLELSDFEGLEFNLTNDFFFKKIEDYGIELIPINGHSIKIPGYGYNNGYYSTQLTLVLSGRGFYKTFDITECQKIEN